MSEPIAWKIEELDYVTSSKLSMDGWVAKGMTITPLYTHPMRELTDEEIWEKICKLYKGKTFEVVGTKENLIELGKAIIKASRGEK
jgi:hypothetical protein